MIRTKNWYRSIRTKVAIVGVVLVLTAIGLVTTVLYYEAKQHLIGLQSQEEYATAARLAAAFDNELTTRRNALERIARSIPIELLDSPSKLHQALAERQGLEALFPEGVSIVSASGDTLIDLPERAGRKGTNVSAREWFQQVKDDRHALIGEPYHGGATKRPLFVIAAPLGNDSTFHGALAATLYLDRGNFIINSFQADTTSNNATRNLYVISKKSRVFVGSRDPSRLLVPVSKPGTNLMADRYMAGYEGFGISINSRGIEQLSASKKLSTVPWHVIVTTATSIVFRPIENFRNQAILWALAFSALGIVAFSLLTNRFLKPIGQASRMVAERLEKPELLMTPIALPTTNDDEVGVLIRGFAKLQSKLVATNDQLVGAVAEQRAILENDLIGIVTTRRRVILWANPAFEKALGYGSGELVGVSTRVFYPTEEAFQAFGEMSIPTLASGKVVRSQAEYVRKDGRQIWMDVCGSALDCDTEHALWGFLDITERKVLEHQIEQSQQRIELALSGAELGIWDLHIPSGKLDHNPRLIEMLGYQAGELEATVSTYISLLCADDRDRFRAIYFSHLKSLTSGIADEHRLRHKDGHWIWVLVRGKVVERDGLGRAVRVSGTSMDISARKLSERTVEQYRFVIQASLDGFWITDTSGKILEVNDTVCQMLGYSRDDLLRLSISDIEADQSADEINEHTRALMLARHGKFEARHRRSDGTIIDVEAAVLYVPEYGERLFGFIRDVTKRKQMEEEVRASEERYRTLIEWSPDPVAVHRGGTLLYVNPAAVKMIGATSSQELTGKSILDWVHPDFHPLVMERVRLVANDGTPTALTEEKFLKVDGTVIDVEVQSRTIMYDKAPAIQVVIRDITERKRDQEQIKNLAYFDVLTQLPNRRLMMDRLGQARSASNRSRQYGALMILDLDNFKTLNDTQGHDVGDCLLVEVAKRISAVVRLEDTVCRLGGDEYVIIVEDLGVDEAVAAGQAEMIAEKIRTALTQPYALLHDNWIHYSTPSIGVTLFNGTVDSIDVLLKQADMALYQAKAIGKNAVRFFSPTMQATVEARSKMEAALRYGMQHGEFELYYQPQFDDGGRLTGAEALLRWFPAHQPPVPPAQFIPLAEETGLILDLGLWVMVTACAQLTAWSRSSRTNQLTISINVSARQFRNAEFVGQVFDTLKASGANPALLKLELTESVVLERIDDVIVRMQQIKALGVTFSLDDFGTGFSSLSYLKRLPIDQVKIDQSFIRDLAIDPNDAAIVRAIIAMSESLGIQVIAEGVENEDQHEFLKKNGCKNFQGYLFGKPLAIRAWDSLIANA